MTTLDETTQTVTRKLIRDQEAECLKLDRALAEIRVQSRRAYAHLLWLRKQVKPCP